MTKCFKPDVMRKMVVFQNHIMRWMTNTRLLDHVTIEDLEEKTNLVSIEDTIKRRKLKWYGHLKRSSLPVKNIFEGLVNGRRRRGRPQRRWRDDISEWVNLPWTQINEACRDKRYWRQFCHDIFV